MISQMILTPPVATALPLFPELPEALTFQLVGFSIVLLTLAFLWVSIECLGALFKFLNLEGKKAQAAQSAAAASAPIEDGLAPESIAVIAAAIHAAYDYQQAFRIRSITTPSRATAPIDGRQVWSTEGRRQIFGSHKVR